MARIAIAVGALLALQGIGFYFGTGAKSVTALIPSFVGVPVLALGLLALKPSLRKHAMHVAAVLGLLGFLAPLGRLASAGFGSAPAAASLIIMLLLCGGFLALCVKSFLDARRRTPGSTATDKG